MAKLGDIAHLISCTQQCRLGDEISESNEPFPSSSVLLRIVELPSARRCHSRKAKEGS